MLRLNLFGGFSLAGPDGAEIPVTSRKGRALLAYLALSPGHARSREHLMALLWSDRGEGQARGSLRQVLTGLRKELGRTADILLIDNERIALETSKLSIAENNGQELLAGLSVSDPQFEDWLRDERLRLSSGASLDAATAPDEEALGLPDIAVLPFENMSKDEAHQHFADGITEDIVTELTRHNTLVVYAPWSSFHYDDERTTEEIAQDLEVDYIIEGSVRRSGERVRITAMLFDAETVNHVWVQRYDRDLSDEFAIQEEVARDIATAVPAKIEADAYELAIERRGRSDLTAYEYVLLGERAQQQDWNAAQARALYEKAIAVDPDCARAFANLAGWHASTPITLFVPFETARDKTRELGEIALTLAPKDAVVLAVLADAYQEVGAYELARQCIDKAIALNPNSLHVMAFAAATLPWLGDVAGGLDWLERFEAHDPLWQMAGMELSLETYYMAGRFEDALAAIVRVSDLPLSVLPIVAAAQAQSGAMDKAAALRARYEAELPSGVRFADHVGRRLQNGADPGLTALWLEGLRKAGFEI